MEKYIGKDKKREVINMTKKFLEKPTSEYNFFTEIDEELYVFPLDFFIMSWEEQISLINTAKEYDTFDEFEADYGWSDWLADIHKISKMPNEYEKQLMNEVLKEAWKQAQAEKE